MDYINMLHYLPAVTANLNVMADLPSASMPDANILIDLPRGNRFEQLSGDRAGQFSMRINDQSGGTLGSVRQKDPSRAGRAAQQFEEDGLAGLESKPSQEKRFWNRIPDSVREQVVELALKLVEMISN